MSSLAFARALLARWDRRVTAPRPLGLVFRTPSLPGRPRAREPRTAQVVPRLHQSVHLELRPAISLTVVRPLSASHTTSMERTESDNSTSERVQVEQLVIRNQSALGAERVVERVLSRSRRVELLDRSVPPGRVGAPVHGRDLPPQLVVQRGAPDHPGVPAREPAPARAAAVPEPPPPVLDLGRLTDQVVSAIDGRLTSHAERLGRR